MRDDQVYLGYIAESIETVEGYLAGPAGSPDEGVFLSDSLRRDAALRLLETLADATTHLSEDLKLRHPEILWRKISDFRNILAHAYTSIDLDLVWGVIVTDLPELRALVDEESDR